MENQKVRVTDIAAAAGVSNATVSRVLNSQSIVNEKTVQKVLSAMRELGYQNIPATRTSIAGEKQSNFIVMNLPSISNPFYSEIYKGAQSAALRYGYQLLLNVAHLSGEPLLQLQSFIKTNHVAGLITLNSLTADRLDQLCRTTNIVQCCEFCEGYNAPSVSIDDYQAARTALDYLYSCGRHRIAFINGAARYKYARHRQKAYLDFITDNHLEYSPDWLITLADIDYAMATAAITQLLSQPNRPDAIFTSSDVLASAVIKVAKRCNLAVPNDLMVIGFDNIDISTICDPTITTVNQPKSQLGYLACELLVNRIANPGGECKHLTLDTELILRESTAL